jgi:hypothetical protein
MLKFPKPLLPAKQARITAKLPVTIAGGVVALVVGLVGAPVVVSVVCDVYGATVGIVGSRKITLVHVGVAILDIVVRDEVGAVGIAGDDGHSDTVGGVVGLQPDSIRFSWQLYGQITVEQAAVEL